MEEIVTGVRYYLVDYFERLSYEAGNLRLELGFLDYTLKFLNLKKKETYGLTTYTML